MFNSTNFLSQYDSLKATSLKSRVLSNSDIEPLLSLLSDTFDVSTLGHSEIGLPIHGVKIGSGPKRILLWSQMHGNESTTTKALFDLFNYLKLEDFNAFLGTCTLFIIPILNPDGAKAYTRLNANKVDLNRDAINRSQKESIILRSVFNEFKPHYCFNLHGQRTIFSAGKSNNSSVISFLSPSEDAERTVTITRKKSMSIIHSMNGVLQIYLPNQIGRYDDGFNANCVGDQFQTLGVPTVLFEAGHYPGDYLREETRKYIALSIFTAIECIAYNKVDEDTSSLYFDIPENDTLFNDVIIRNALLDPSNPNDFCDIGIQHKEVLGPNGLLFKPTIDFIGDLSKKHGHMEINANFNAVSHPDFSVLSENYEIDFLLVEFVKKALFIENNLT
tara:strand:+ start:226 stop:1392 length:1167 start_codon:yes stop_codon:yes gene_type:complete